MQDVRSGYAGRSEAREQVGTATLLGQVMFLVAVALGFTVAGTYIGRELSDGTAFILFLVGFGMLIAQSFVAPLRVGTVGICWLYAIALCLGLGLGPAIGYLVENDPSTVTQAAGATALITLGMGAGGFALSKDISGWMRPLSYIILGCVVVSFGDAAVLQRRQPDPQRDHRDRLGAAHRRRLQLPAQARHRRRRDLAGDRDLRLDHQHLPVAAEPVQ